GRKCHYPSVEESPNVHSGGFQVKELVCSAAARDCAVRNKVSKRVRSSSSTRYLPVTASMSFVLVSGISRSASMPATTASTQGRKDSIASSDRTKGFSLFARCNPNEGWSPDAHSARAVQARNTA